MDHWFKLYQVSSRETKIFFATLLLFGIVIVASTVYSYARLIWIHQDQKEQIQKNS